MKTIGDIVCPADLSPGEYAYPENNRRYYVECLYNGNRRCGVVCRMFSRDGSFYVHTFGLVTYRVSGDNLEYQLCTE